MNLIYYFTGTGNSLRVAKELSEKLPDCEIENIVNARKITKAYDRIGIVTPVYCSGLPTIVAKFLENTDFSTTRDAYFFIVTTYGGSSGFSINFASDILNSKNIKLHYASSIKMFSNYIALYPMSKNRQESSKVKEAISNISSDIINKYETKINKANSLSLFLHTKFMNTFPTKSKYYSVNDNCLGCAICEKICPSNNITMENNKPTFNNKCEQCVACIQWCPNQAINYKNKTQTRGRYTNPSIKVEELFRSNKTQN